MMIAAASNSQKVDYLKVRDELVVLTCGGPKDSADVFESIRRLEAFDTSIIKRNINRYYEDLGTYYWLVSGLHDNVYTKKAISAFKSALYHEPHSRKALWDLAFAYGIIHECETAKIYFAEYHKYTPLKYESNESKHQENQLLVKCESKN